MNTDKMHTISALLLVAGTCIGGGMLALPVATGCAGFVPSLVLLVLCWAMMSSTGLLIMELTLHMEDDVHIMTIASRLMGRSGKVLAWLLFLYVSYASVVAYAAGGGVTMSSFTEKVFGVHLGRAEGIAVFTLIFGGVVAIGTEWVGRVNDLLFTIMIVAYFVLIGIGIPEIKMENLSHMSWRGVHGSIPLLLTAFSFQAFLIPSLTNYLHRDVKALRISIVGGAALALVVYIAWQALVLGAIPVEGEFGLRAAFDEAKPATEYLRRVVSSPWVSSMAECFAFFALVTSFLGIGLGLHDFLADALKLPKKGLGNVWLGLLCIVPTIFCAIYFEKAFLVALDTSGGVGDTILNGLMPIIMVWGLRYVRREDLGYRWFGGRPVLLFLGAFYAAALCIEFFNLRQCVL